MLFGFVLAGIWVWIFVFLACLLYTLFNVFKAVFLGLFFFFYFGIFGFLEEEEDF